MSITNDTAVYFDPYDVDINADPYPVYERLREEAPAYYNDRYDFWALSRHEDVQKAHVNWQTFSNPRREEDERGPYTRERFSNRRGPSPDFIRAGGGPPPGVILSEAPPLHTMHR